MPVDVSFLVTGGGLRGPLHEDARPSHSITDDLPAGSRLGPFEIVRKIGAGGSGTVYLAQRIEEFEQTVAVKVVRADERLRERFRSERNFLSMLEHPGIARIIDGGESEGGVLWSAMEYVDGKPIDRYCDDAGADWRSRLMLMIRVCDAVQFAHQQLVVHGDIKPNNILVDGSGVPRLLDFGIATRAGDGEPALGFTPAYASPEQVAGIRLTASSDVYQLGALLADLISPVRLPALASKNIKAVIDRAVAQEIAERFESVAQLRGELERVLAGQYTRARAWSPPVKSLFFVTRRWRELLFSFLASAALFTLDVYYTMRLRDERDHAEMEKKTALATSNFLSSLFRVAAPSEANAATVVDILDQGSRNLMDTAIADRAVLASTLASAYLSMDRADKAAETLARLDEVPAAEMAAAPSVRAHLMALRARVSIETNDIDKASQQLAKAEAMRAQIREDEARELALHLATTRSQILSRQGRLSEAMRNLEAALKNNSQSESVEAAEALSQLGNYKGVVHEIDAAFASYRRSAAILDHLLGPEAPASLAAKRRLAFHYAVNHRLEEAKQLLDAQEALIALHFGKNSLEYANLLQIRGVVAGIGKDLAVSIDCFRREVAILRNIGMGETKTAAHALQNLGNVLGDSGDYEHGIPLLRESLRIRQLLEGPAAGDTIGLQMDLSTALCMHSEWRAAKEQFDDAIQHETTIGWERLAEVAIDIRDHAQCLLDHGRLADARSSLVLKAEQWRKLSADEQKEWLPLYTKLGVDVPTL